MLGNENGQLSEISTSGMEQIPSPDGYWWMVLDRAAGSLDIAGAPGQQIPVFAPGSAVSGAKWSPDSLRLAVVLSDLPNWTSISSATTRGGRVLRSDGLDRPAHSL